MNRIQQIDRASATGKAKQFLDAVNAKLGIVPNLTHVLAKGSDSKVNLLSDVHFGRRSSSPQ